jgi:hypothetical protein
MAEQTTHVIDLKPSIRMVAGELLKPLEQRIEELERLAKLQQEQIDQLTAKNKT